MIQGTKCYLRPLVLEDVSYLNQWNSDEELNRYLGNGFYPVSIDTQKEWMKNMIDTSKFSPSKRYIICTPQDEVIGLIGIYNTNFINQNCEVGLYLGNRNFQGQGIGKEAYELLENYIKQYMNMIKIKLFVVLENTTAVKFWEKRGFHQTGILHKERYINAEFKDVAIMEKYLKEKLS